MSEQLRIAKSHTKARKVRSRIQRAFLNWLLQNRQRFKMPVEIARRTDRKIELLFIGLHPAFSVCLNSRGFDISINLQGLTWDALYSIEVMPSPTEGGYHCKWYYPEFQQVYISREALWANEGFELLLKIVNEKLAPAKWLALFLFSPCTSSWAELHVIKPAANEYLIAILPCRTECLIA